MGITFQETKLKGSFVIEPERFEDNRGFFARSFSQTEFAAYVDTSQFVECGISYSHKKFTVRGMHFQSFPHAQGKLVRCTRGAIYDAIIDLRTDSPSYGQWIAAELTAQNQLMLYVPEGFAHGFQTLEDSCEVFYQLSSIYAPEAECGVRWDDPAFNIHWPERVNVTINERDRRFPDYQLVI